MKTWEEFLRTGGDWIGSARAWMQRKKRNGSRVTWGSDEALEPPMTVREVEDVVSNASWAAYQMGYEAADKVAELQVKEYRKVLQALYVAVPAIGHHDLPAYDCPAQDLAKAMNEAAKALGQPEPYPRIEKRIDDPPQPPRVICDCGTPGCNRLYDHRRGGSNFLG